MAVARKNGPRTLTIALLILGALGAACNRQPAGAPAIEFTQIPNASGGGEQKMEQIAGRARGARGQRIVLYAKAGPVWWIQPFANNPFTEIQPDSTWQSPTHLGTDYAALVVEPTYNPPKKTNALPERGGLVVLVAQVQGKNPIASVPETPKTVRFSGYDWSVTHTDNAGRAGTTRNENVWTDSRGFLHLRVARRQDSWTSAEVRLQRSLGYGTYSFLVREMSLFDPATALGIFTWDNVESGQNNREIDIELSQWGDPLVKNAQFVVQPYYVPANCFRFVAPRTAHRHSFRWEPGRVTFKSVNESTGQNPATTAEHAFTSGVPTPGGETVHMNLYVYALSRTPQRNPVEVVIEKFEFLP